MKTFKHMLIILSLVVLSSVSYAENTITISTGTSGIGWNEYAKHYGYMLHLTTEAFALAGINVNIKFFPWKRTYSTVKEADVDASCCWFFVKERAQHFYYSDPVFEETMVFFHLKSFPFEWKNMGDLAGIRSGGNRGFHYGDEFQAAEKNGSIIVERVKNNDMNLRKLLAGRIQVHPIAVITAYGHLRKLLSPEKVELFTYHPKPILQKKLHLIIPKKMEEKKAKQLLASFNQGLKLLKESGKYDKIKKNAETDYYELMQTKWAP